MRFTIQPPENTSYVGGRVSPNGRWLALVTTDDPSKGRLWLRSLDSLIVRPLATAAVGSTPFWSPDSRFIVFLQDDKLQKIGITGGVPQTICRTPLLIGGSWNRGGTILFGTSTGGGPEIFQVPAAGGDAKVLVRLNASRRETQIGFPTFLPDGRHFLFTVYSGLRENGGIYLASVDAPDSRIHLLRDVSNSEYAPASAAHAGTGYLLFARGEGLMAQGFGAEDLQVKGEPFLVVDQILRSADSNEGSFSASADGVLLVTPVSGGDRLTWFDRTGRKLETVGNTGLHFYPQISPDQRTLVVDELDIPTFTPHLWLFPVPQGAAKRFTFRDSLRPLWSPDGGFLAGFVLTFLFRGSRDAQATG